MLASDKKALELLGATLMPKTIRKALLNLPYAGWIEEEVEEAEDGEEGRFGSVALNYDLVHIDDFFATADRAIGKLKKRGKTPLWFDIWDGETLVLAAGSEEEILKDIEAYGVSLIKQATWYCAAPKCKLFMKKPNTYKSKEGLACSCCGAPQRDDKMGEEALAALKSKMGIA